MILRILPFWLNVDFVVVLFGESVGVDTATSAGLSTSHFASVMFNFCRRVAGNGRKLWQICRHVQGSGKLVQVSRFLKFKIHQLFAGQGVLFVQSRGQKPCPTRRQP